MELENILKELYQNEDSKLKKYVLFMILKFSHLVKPLSTHSREYLPLLSIQQDRLILIYQDTELDGLEYIFSDYEEILIVLEKLFHSGASLYFYYEPPAEALSRAEILQQIEEALAADDPQQFQLLVFKLKQMER